MIGENMQGFLSNLLELTQKKQLDWKPLSALDSHKNLMAEFLQAKKYEFDSSADTFIDCSINDSYFIKKNDGFIVLADMICKDNDGPIYHKLLLLTKINMYLPLSDYGCFDTFGKDFETLKLCIENNISEDYMLPDSLYKFWYSIES